MPACALLIMSALFSADALRLGSQQAQPLSGFAMQDKDFAHATGSATAAQAALAASPAVAAASSAMGASSARVAASPAGASSDAERSGEARSTASGAGFDGAASATPGGAHAAAEAARGASSEQALRLSVPALTREQHNVVRFIARKYSVALDAAQQFVHEAYRVASEMRVDPHLVLAVMSVESSFNPQARSSQGAQGLMQVLARVHVEKFEPFGGMKAAFDPIANIRVGTRILKDYMERTGSVQGALKWYVGAALLDDDGGYGVKVLGARERIAAAAAGRPIPPEPPRSIAPARPAVVPVRAREPRPEDEPGITARRDASPDHPGDAADLGLLAPPPPAVLTPASRAASNGLDASGGDYRL